MLTFRVAVTAIPRAGLPSRASKTRQGVTPSGSVTFVVDGVPRATVALKHAGAAAVATLSTAGLPVGPHTVTALYRGDARFGPSHGSVAVRVLPAPVRQDGPRITGVARFGIHAQPTTLVLSFNTALDPARAQDVANYRIAGPHGRPVAVASAVYDPAAHTVLLSPVHQLDLHRVYRLTVVGAGPRGVTDAEGRSLDGAGTGRPGSDFAAPLTAANLVLGADVPRGPAQLGRLRRTVTRLAAWQLESLRASHARN